MQDEWGKIFIKPPPSDLNEDGIVNGLDLDILIEQWDIIEGDGVCDELSIPNTIGGCTQILCFSEGGSQEAQGGPDNIQTFINIGSEGNNFIEVRGSGKYVTKFNSYTNELIIKDGELKTKKTVDLDDLILDGNKIIDEVLVSVFKEPKSYTKENLIEISCHGSAFIVTQIIKLLISQGARPAQPGEFTKRAFLNGQYDLAQAEAVADLIASDSEAAHQAAMNQMRGGFSAEIKLLREKLVHFASLIELELDFGEEDVEFANRKELKVLVRELQNVIQPLIDSFDLGNVIKDGVPIVIAGKPNVGKSTLLNALLNEEKAIVSEIPGTTRDYIEDRINIDGISFRFTDTAGLRKAKDKIEAIGVELTHQKMSQASLIIYIFDVNETSPEKLKEELKKLNTYNIPYLIAGNKTDKCNKPSLNPSRPKVRNRPKGGREDTISSFKKLFPGNIKGTPLPYEIIFISALNNQNIDKLKKKLLELVNAQTIKTANTVVTNVRHYDSLVQTRDALNKVLDGIETGKTGDIVALDIRNGLHYLGEITGEITTEDLLENIFSKFCIGK
ncbi:MAG: tRNA uridine-5-carboxymethylaminomethyl(34) synthesis GTPase MnmE [Bacteroidetes bacterium]|nr:tRNA uridine-5-carboxymethylaminomethyl(34) synthesis GTPase MnmE [Bacteroidota bacterium]